MWGQSLYRRDKMVERPIPPRAVRSVSAHIRAQNDFRFVTME